MKPYTVILCDNFRFADYHVLAEDNSVAVTRDIRTLLGRFRREKRGTVLRSLTAITSNFRLSRLVQLCKKIKQAVSNQQPWVLGAFPHQRYVSVKDALC